MIQGHEWLPVSLYVQSGLTVVRSALSNGRNSAGRNFGSLFPLSQRIKHGEKSAYWCITYSHACLVAYLLTQRNFAALLTTIPCRFGLWSFLVSQMLVAPAIHCRIPEHLGMERVSSSGKLGAWTFRVDNVLSRCGTRLMKLDSTLNQFLPSYQALVFESPLEQNLHLYGVLSTNPQTLEIVFGTSIPICLKC